MSTPIETTRDFLREHVADQDPDELVNALEATAMLNAGPMVQALKSIEHLLAHPPQDDTLLQLVTADAGVKLQSPSVESARIWLEGLARQIRRELDENLLPFQPMRAQLVRTSPPVDERFPHDLRLYPTDESWPECWNAVWVPSVLYSAFMKEWDGRTCPTCKTPTVQCAPEENYRGNPDGSRGGPERAVVYRCGRCRCGWTERARAVANRERAPAPADRGGRARLPPDDRSRLQIMLEQMKTTARADYDEEGFLVALNLAGRGLTSLSPMIGQFRRLRSLLLGATVFDNGLRFEGGLSSQNALTSLPEEIGMLDQLETLQLSDNLLTALPEEMGALRSLTSLELQNNRIAYLPAAAGRLSRIKDINLSNNALRGLPDECAGWLDLQTLNLSNNPLRQLPKVVCRLPSLRSLNLFATNWTPKDAAPPPTRQPVPFFPDELGMLHDLEVLQLGSNLLNDLPEAMWRLRSLRVLDLGHNALTEIPAEIGNLRQLQSLVISRNKLASLPDQIGNLENLRRLEADKNQLVRLPDGFTRLQQLEHLSLVANPLGQFPMVLCSLPRLKTVNLASTRLPAIPPEIGQLLSLEVLWVLQNPLETLPWELARLPQLTEVQLPSDARVDAAILDAIRQRIAKNKARA